MWAEREYNRKPHRELGMSPLERSLKGPSVGRPSPSTEALRSAFRMSTERVQRRSDGTISVEGRRFELPSRFRTLLKPKIRYARWDLSNVELVDPHTDKVLDLLFPLDKQRNATSKRRVLSPLADDSKEDAPPTEPIASGIAPALREMLRDYAETGLPSAYVPLPPKPTDEADDDTPDATTTPNLGDDEEIF